MKKNLILLLVIVCQQGVYSQVRYSSSWFGPNANPVPEFTDATIPSKTTISLMGDYYFGHGDRTKNGYIKVDIPLLSERVSLKIWSAVLEHYQTTEEVMQNRGANTTSGSEVGDIYVQTRIRLWKEQKNRPSIILNSTLKTASAKSYATKRYFDTPGYYFDVEMGKSFFTKNSFISEIRLVADAGFLCWETTNSAQDDAPMYGGKIILGNQDWKMENTLSGYWGWKNLKDKTYGDVPLVYSVKLIKQTKNLNYFAQYQYGIHDFPYNQIRVGVSFTLSKLTPNFK
jgi:hypothetical protein